jgi:hypothetical protein
MAAEYYISTVIIKGVAFKSQQPLELPEVVKLARELNARGYTFHIDKKISDNRYEMRTLSELEQLVR